MSPALLTRASRVPHESAGVCRAAPRYRGIMRRPAAFAILLLAACGGGGDSDGDGDATLLTATFDNGSQETALEVPCEVTIRSDGFSFVASDGDRFGLETVWESAAVAGPGTYASELLGGVVVFAMFPDPDDPSAPTFRDAEGMVEFATYDPPARVAGSFDATVPGFPAGEPPRYHITGSFDCAE